MLTHGSVQGGSTYSDCAVKRVRPATLFDILRRRTRRLCALVSPPHYYRGLLMEDLVFLCVCLFLSTAFTTATCMTLNLPIFNPVLVQSCQHTNPWPVGDAPDQVVLPKEATPLSSVYLCLHGVPFSSFAPTLM